MIFLSYTCKPEDLEKSKKWLKDDVGVSIYKIVDVSDSWCSSSKMPQHSWKIRNRISGHQIIFYVIDSEHEMLLKLKYPPDTFENCMV